MNGSTSHFTYSKWQNEYMSCRWCTNVSPRLPTQTNDTHQKLTPFQFCSCRWYMKQILRAQQYVQKKSSSLRSAIQNRRSETMFIIIKNELLRDTQRSLTEIPHQDLSSDHILLQLWHEIRWFLYNFSQSSTHNVNFASIFVWKSFDEVHFIFSQESDSLTRLFFMMSDRAFPWSCLPVIIDFIFFFRGSDQCSHYHRYEIGHVDDVRMRTIQHWWITRDRYWWHLEADSRKVAYMSNSILKLWRIWEVVPNHGDDDTILSE